tara:strand:+ start:316 stop:621 length:306 start_codon:yes stop_codon:yes gene_type:complete
MKLTRENLKQLIRESFEEINEGSHEEGESNDLNIRWSRYMDNYKSDPRIRKTTNSCLGDGSSGELSELLTDILESIQDETIKDRFLVIVPQMVEERLRESK